MKYALFILFLLSSDLLQAQTVPNFTSLTRYSRPLDSLGAPIHKVRTLQFLTDSGHIESSVDEVWKASGWNQYKKSVFTNNASGQPTTITELEFDSLSNQERDRIRVEFAYDLEGRRVSHYVIYNRYAGQTQILDTVFLETYVYTSFGQFLSSRTNWYLDGVLGRLDKVERKFDASNRLVEENYSTDLFDGSPLKVFRQKYIYQPGLNYDYLIENYYTSPDGTFRPLHERHLCKQVTNTKTSTQQNLINGVWLASSSEEETFDADGRVTQRIYTRNPNPTMNTTGILVPSFLQEYKYRSDGAPLFIRASQYDQLTLKVLPAYALYVFGYKPLGKWPTTEFIQPLVYPNPATDVVHIDNPGNHVQYQLVSVSGIVHESGILGFGPNQIAIQNLNTGTYFLRLNENNQNLHTIPIVVKH